MQMQDVKLTFFFGSHLALKYFKVVANFKKLMAIMTHTKKKCYPVTVLDRLNCSELLSSILRFTSRYSLLIYMYENIIRIAQPHGSHAWESMLCSKTERITSMLVHLQIISAESNKITESKLKLLYVRRALYRKNIFFRS